MNVDEIAAARERIAGQVMRTPLLESRTLSALVGARLYLKFENLQFTASFKERGALNCLLCLDEAERRRGVIGVQMERFPGAYNAFHGGSAGAVGSATVAEGIAVKRPGGHTLPLIRAHVDDLVLVTEAQVEQAVFQLLEIEKTVVEGAGAAPLAAVAADPAAYTGQNVVLVLSGGNIDMMILASVVQRGLVRTRRLVRMGVEIPDVPGGLADLARLLADLDSNIVEIEHERMFASSSVRATRVEVLLQLRGEEQVEQILAALAERGYEAALSN
jgi:threonine dehydratase